MKSRITTIVALLAIVCSATAQNLTVQSIEAKPGEQAEIVASVSGATSMTALQFNLALPEGVTLAGDDATLGAATNSHTLSVQTLNNGDRLIVMYSENLNTFMDGELLRIPVTVGSNATGGDGRLYTVRMATTNAVSQTCSETTFAVTVTATKTAQPLSLTTLPEMTEGDAAYTLPQKTDQGLTLTWSVANTTIASISAGKLTPLKAGTTTVTATQAGNDTYQSFTKTFTLTVKEKPAPTDPDTDISLLQNTVYVNRIEARAGETVTLSVKMKNSFLAEGFQFDLVLPEGISVALDEYGDPIAELSTERTSTSITNHFDADFKLDGSLNIQAYSSKGRTISGSDGEVARITIKVSENLTAGEYPIVLKNIAITDENSATVTVDRVKSTLEIPAYKIGDANNDGNVNVGDLTAISHYILERPDASFLFQAADANQDGYVNVGDLTAVSHIILWGSITRPQAATSRASKELDPQ